MPFDAPRSAPLFKLYGALSKVEDNDDGTITVFGIASSETRDHAGEVVAADAMKAALPDYSKFPALREMHQPMAAGKVVKAEVDADGVTHIEALVVDPVAIVKVRTGVYGGFSIGGKVTKRDPADRTKITGLRLVEISLVDSPCNPDAALTMWKADLMPFIPSADAVVTRAKELAKAAGTKRFSDFLFDAREELIAEDVLKNGVDELAAPAATETEEAPAAETTEEPTAEAAPEVVAETETAEQPTAETTETTAEVDPEKEAAATVDPDEDDHAGEGAHEPTAENQPKEAADAVEGSETTVDPVNALTQALADAEKAATPEAPVAEEAPVDPFADLDAAGTALKAIEIKAPDGVAVPETIQKGMYDVSRLADLLCGLASVQRCAADEASWEGDNSPIPAELAAAVQNVAGILVRMAQEEVAELVASLATTPDMEIIVVEDVALANEIVDAVKANETLSGEVADRLAKRAPAAPEVVEEQANAGGEDVAKSLEEKDAKIAELSKALLDAVPAVENLTAMLEAQKGEIADLRKRFEEEPLPAKTAGPAVTRTVSKSADAEGGASAGNDANDPTAGLSGEALTKYLDSLPEAERGQILVKAALARPVRIAMPTA